MAIIDGELQEYKGKVYDAFTYLASWQKEVEEKNKAQDQKLDRIIELLEKMPANSMGSDVVYDCNHKWENQICTKCKVHYDYYCRVYLKNCNGYRE